MSTQFEPLLFWRYISSSIDRLVAVTAGLGDAELDWRPPAPETSSLHALAMHTMGNAEENLLGTLGGLPIARDRDGEFGDYATAQVSAEARWGKLRPRLAALLADLPDEALDAAYPHPRRGTITGRDILIVVARHAAEHLGQAELTRDLLRAAHDRAG